MSKFVDKFVLAIKTDDVTGGIRDVDSHELFTGSSCANGLTKHYEGLHRCWYIFYDCKDGSVSQFG